MGPRHGSLRSGCKAFSGKKAQTRSGGATYAEKHEPPSAGLCCGSGQQGAHGGRVHAECGYHRARRPWGSEVTLPFGGTDSQRKVHVIDKMIEAAAQMESCRLPWLELVRLDGWSGRRRCRRFSRGAKAVAELGSDLLSDPGPPAYLPDNEPLVDLDTFEKAARCVVATLPNRDEPAPAP